MKRLLTTTGLAVALAMVLGSGCGSDEGGSAGDDGSSGSGNGATDGGAGRGGDSGASGSSGSGNGGTSGSGTGGRGGAGGRDGGSSGADGGQNCGTTAVGASSVPVNMLVVLDRSGSMSFPYGSGATTRWATTTTALKTTLTNTRNSIDYGLMLFPFRTQGIPRDCDPYCCSMPTPGTLQVPIQDGPVSVPAINTQLDANSPGGATPTAKALRSALTYFQSAAGQALQGRKFVLLATDGGPNCGATQSCSADQCTLNIENASRPGTCRISNCCAPGYDTESCLDETATVQAVRDLATAGIQTFVIGLDIAITDYRDVLNQLAIAGGRALPTTSPTRYYNASGNTNLASVFNSITQQLITSCNLKLEENPPDINKLNVVVDNTTVLRGDANGWRLDTTTSPPTVVLQGTLCQRVQTSGAQNIQVVYGCPTVQVPE